MIHLNFQVKRNVVHLKCDGSGGEPWPPYQDVSSALPCGPEHMKNDPVKEMEKYIPARLRACVHV